MNACTCKFYEVDLEAQAEGEALAAAYDDMLGEEGRAAEAAWLAMQDPEPDPFAGCGPYCRHARSGKGMPGEYVYGCGAPGNEHIIHVDFNEAEIR